MDKHIEIWNIARELKLDHRFYEGLDTLLTKIESDNRQLILQNVTMPKGTVCDCAKHKPPWYVRWFIDWECPVCGKEQTAW